MEREREREREPIVGLLSTRHDFIYRIVPQDCFETARVSQRVGAREGEQERVGESEQATPIHAVFGVVVIVIVIVKVKDGTLHTIAYCL